MKDKVDLFYDLFDEAALLHYETLELKYLDAFIKVSGGFFGGVGPALGRREAGKAEENL